MPSSSFWGVSTRELVTLDVETGVTTSVGNTGDKFASITFGSDGTLYGITGDGVTSPQSLYSLSTTTAAATLLTSRGTPVEEVTDGDGGERSGSLVLTIDRRAHAGTR